MNTPDLISDYRRRTVGVATLHHFDAIEFRPPYSAEVRRPRKQEGSQQGARRTLTEPAFASILFSSLAAGCYFTVMYAAPFVSRFL